MLDTSKVEIWTGNQAVAEAAIVSRPEVIAAYPITPSTPIIQRLSDAVGNGELAGEFIAVESEHAAMSGVVGGSVAGARAFTATASQGLLYMMEMIYWAGYGRLPMTIALVNRALAPGWSIWVDHQDMYSMRDAGWMQLIAKNNQEAHDLIPQSFKISENHDVYMPSAVNIDGFVLSHVAAQVEPLSQKFVDDFLPPFNPIIKMDPANPVSFGSLTLADDYALLRKDLSESMERAKKVIYKVTEEFAELTGRDWGRLVAYYGPESADVAVIAVGSMAEEAEEAVDILNNMKTGTTFGVLRIRSLRPFPQVEIVKATEKYDKFIIFDRAFSFGSDTPLTLEIRNALLKGHKDIPILSKSIGFGGADVSFRQLVREIQEILVEDD